MATDMKAIWERLNGLKKVYPDDYVRQTTKFDVSRAKETVKNVAIIPPERFRVRVKNVKLGSFSPSFQISRSEYIKDLKLRLQSYSGGYAPESQRLLLNGKVLLDGKKILDYDMIEPEATLTLMIKAGAKPAEDVSSNESARTIPPPKSPIKLDSANPPFPVSEDGKVPPSKDFVDPQFWTNLEGFLTTQFLGHTDGSKRLLTAFKQGYLDMTRSMSTEEAKRLFSQT